METIRDSAFGKLLRIFSGGRWLKYREEVEALEWTAYIKQEPNTQINQKAEGAPGGESSDTWGLYTVMSQASKPSRRSTRGPLNQEDGVPILIGWSGPDDSEVSPRNFFSKITSLTLILTPEPSELEQIKEITCE